MAATIVNYNSSKLLQVISSLKYLHLGHLQHGCPSNLQRSVWSGSLFYAKDSRRTRGTKIDFPDKPKYPANIFILFSQKVAPQIEKSNPGMKRTEIIREISKMWRELDPEEKSRMAIERREAYDKYKEDLKVYMENITPEQVIEMERRKQIQTARNLKRRRRSLGMPQKPVGAYNYFLSEKFQERTDEPVPTFFKQVMEQWRQLSDSEKEKYYERAEENKKQYVLDMAKWEKEMIALGRYDVIRQSSLKQLGKTKRPRRSRSSSQPKDEHDL